MRISRVSLSVAALLASLFGAVATMPGSALAYDEDPAVEAVYQDGLLAFRSQQTDHGLNALRAAADNGHFMARFYLARILASNNNGFTDHRSAFELFKSLAQTDVDPDPQYDWRAVVMPNILLQYATYLMAGLPADNLSSEAIAPDPDAARDQIIRAAQVYGDPDAQFALAKLDLQDESTARAGLDQMATLAERRGHAAAQAFLADLWLTGHHVGSVNPALAFAYMTLAVENAPEQERIWIVQQYSQTYCATPATERAASAAYVDGLRKMNDEQDIPRVEAPETDDGLSGVLVSTESGLNWRCSNGEQVALPGVETGAPNPDGDSDGVVPVGVEPDGDGTSGALTPPSTIEANGGSAIAPASGPSPVETLLGGTMMGLGANSSTEPALSGQSQALGD